MRYCNEKYEEYVTPGCVNSDCKSHTVTADASPSNLTDTHKKQENKFVFIC